MALFARYWAKSLMKFNNLPVNHTSYKYRAYFINKGNHGLKRSHLLMVTGLSGRARVWSYSAQVPSMVPCVCAQTFHEWQPTLAKSIQGRYFIFFFILYISHALNTFCYKCKFNFLLQDHEGIILPPSFHLCTGDNWEAKLV